MKKSQLSALLLCLAALGISNTAFAADNKVSTPATAPAANTRQATPVATSTAVPSIESSANFQNGKTDRKSINPNRFDSLREYIFSDVPADHWASQSISTMAQAKILSGYSDGTYHPDAPLKREEAASVFSNLIGERPGVMLASPYADITSDRWSAVAIDFVSKNNIMSGYGDNSFKPDKYMSRQEFAVVADNYLHYVGYQTEDPTALDDIHFSDQKFVAPWAQDAVRELAHLGFIAYNPKGLFNPEKYITRAEAAEITYRMTYTPEALKLKQHIVNENTKAMAEKLIDKTFDYDGDFSKFYNKGAMFLNDGKLVITTKDKKATAALTNKLNSPASANLQDKVVLINSKYSQADFDKIQDAAIQLYEKSQPKGTIQKIVPNATGDQLIITANPVTAETQAAFKKEFATKVLLEEAKADDTITWERPITYNFGPGQRKLTNK